MRASTRQMCVVVFLIATVAFQQGCAVLTVDVDVYKGPLSNHKRVQAQQVAVLALAAKPMLGRLRYRLELYAIAIANKPKSEVACATPSSPSQPMLLERSGGTPIYPTTRSTDELTKWRECQFKRLRDADIEHRTDYIAPPSKNSSNQTSDNRAYEFVGSHSRFINSIFAQYNDDSESKAMADSPSLEYMKSDRTVHCQLRPRRKWRHSERSVSGRVPAWST